jgi:hypothetical protein
MIKKRYFGYWIRGAQRIASRGLQQSKLPVAGNARKRSENMIDTTNFINHGLFKPNQNKRRKNMYNLRTHLDHDALVKLMTLILGYECSKITKKRQQILTLVYAALGYSIEFSLDKGQVTATIFPNQEDQEDTSIERVPIPVEERIASTRSRQQVLELYNLLTGEDAKNITDNVIAVNKRVFSAIGYTADWNRIEKTLKLKPADVPEPAFL